MSDEFETESTKNRISKINKIFLMKIDIVTVASRGQVIIPSDIRKELDIKEEEKLLMCEMEGSILFKKVGIKEKKDLEKIFSLLWKRARERKIIKEEVEEEIRKRREEKK